MKIETFLSHADEDKKIARELADKLNEHGFDVFVAHDDIEIGDEWEKTLKNRIEKCELFLVLLSKNFRQASFTDHEVGIASYLNKRIFPIRIDEIKPYGFMKKFQAGKISTKMKNDEIGNLAKRLLTFTEAGKEDIDMLVHEFCAAGSFVDANELAEILFSYTNFTTEQINEIATGFLTNDQIHRAWTANPETVNFIVKHWGEINPELKQKIKKFLPFSKFEK